MLKIESEAAELFRNNDGSLIVSTGGQAFSFATGAVAWIDEDATIIAEADAERLLLDFTQRLNLNFEAKAAAAVLGRKGGQASAKVQTPAKAQASRANGTKGGRPKART